MNNTTGVIRPRALEALEVIARGAADRAEVAEAMHCSPHTVKNHLAHAARHYGTTGRGRYTTLHTVLAALKAGDIARPEQKADRAA